MAMTDVEKVGSRLEENCVIVFVPIKEEDIKEEDFKEEDIKEEDFKDEDIKKEDFKDEDIKEEDFKEEKEALCCGLVY